jgi:excisionase family DNA binding protein
VQAASRSAELYVEALRLVFQVCLLLLWIHRSPGLTMVRPLRASVQGCIGLRVEHRTAQTASSFMTIGEAAELLGVSEMTLRRWDKAGKFKARRHPINHYRVYRRTEVLRLRARIERGVA